MSVQVKGSGTIGGLDEGLVVSGIVTSSTQVNVGSNIKLGNAGVVTATSFVGSGANLTSLPSQLTLSNNADNRVITGGSGTNLNGEANLLFDGSKLLLGATSSAAGSLVVKDNSGNQIWMVGRSSDNTSSLSFRNNADNAYVARIQSDSNAGMQFELGGTERLRILSSGLQKITQSANITDGTFYSTVTISSPNGVYQGIRFDRGNVPKWRIGMKNDDTFQIANLFHNGSAGAEDNCVRITDNDDINITGNLKISTAGNGIDFSATADGHGSPSELLDDYEEGSYTPTLSGSGWSYTRQYGFYRKVGTIVHVSIWIGASGGPNNSSSLGIGLPFTSYSNSSYRGGISGSFDSANFDNSYTSGRNRTHINANVTHMQASFPFIDNGGWTSGGLTNAGVYDGFQAQLSGTYMSNS